MVGLGGLCFDGVCWLWRLGLIRMVVLVVVRFLLLIRRMMCRFGVLVVVRILIALRVTLTMILWVRVISWICRLRLCVGLLGVCRLRLMSLLLLILVM